MKYYLFNNVAVFFFCTFVSRINAVAGKFFAQYVRVRLKLILKANAIHREGDVCEECQDDFLSLSVRVGTKVATLFWHLYSAFHGQ